MMLATMLQAAAGAALGNGVIAVVSVSLQWSQSHVSPRRPVISAAQ